MHRTDTTSINTFQLPAPAAVTMTSMAPPQRKLTHAIHITVPHANAWRMPYHWHTSQNQRHGACESVKCLSGFLYAFIAEGLFVNYTRAGSTGMKIKFAPDERVAWDRNGSRKGDITPLEVEFVADQILWRNHCSATLDKDIYPQLDTTPFWMKFLFATLGAIPRWRNNMLNAILWVQLQTIFYAHNVHVYRGFIPFMWPWEYQPFGGRPPQWARRLQIGSIYFIARMVITASYWLGRLVLGMQGRYAEYTPSNRFDGDVKN